MKTRLVKIGEAKGLEVYEKLFKGYVVEIFRDLNKTKLDGVYKYKDGFLYEKDYLDQNFFKLQKYFAITLSECRNISANFYEEEEIHWYHDIPEHGILCRVSDYDSGQNKKIFKLIVKYLENADRFTDSDGCSWNYATPLTNEEIKKFLREEN